MEAKAEIAPQGGKADGVLILLVEEVGDVAGQGDASPKVVTSGEIEARVARVFKLGWSGEIAIGAASGEVSGEIRVGEPDRRRDWRI